MSTTYPTTKQSIPNPTSTDLLENADNTLDHDYQHATINDTIEALQDKVGVDGSAVTTSHDYKLSAVTGSQKALTSGTSSQSVTGLTLVNPVLTIGSDATGDMYYRNSGGDLTRLPAGTDGQIISYASGLPTAIANPAASDASTTVKGVSEEATQAEVLARTAAGGTSARLFVNPTTLTTVQTYDYAADSVGTDAYAITVAPAPVAYVTGQTFTFKAGTANTGACTLNVNSLGAKTIKKNYNSDLGDNDILANQTVTVIYDGTNFQVSSLLNDASIVDNTTNNIASASRNYYTYTVLPVDGLQGWTSPAGTFTTTPSMVYVGGGTSGASISGALFGLNGDTADIGRKWNSGIDSKMSYIMQADKASVGTSPIDGSDVWYYHGYTGGASNVAQLGNITNTSEERVGFTHYNAKIYAVTCNASAVTTTEISATDTLRTRRHFMVDFTPSSCRFYLNGLLVATHTTNIPSSGNAMYMFWGSVDNASGSPYFGITPITISETIA